MGRKQRLDLQLVELGLATSRQQAQQLIRAGKVRSGDRVLDKPGLDVLPDLPLQVEQPPRFVSRGGEKLDGALSDFGLVVEGRFCLDAGSSTGGFTDCLLQRGAAHVIAVDVGRGQLHHRLLSDDRVTSWESRNILDVSRTDIALIDGYADATVVVVADLSFTSSARVAGHLVELSGNGGDIVVMVKPQFEAPRDEVPEGGVVRDPAVHARAVAAVVGALEAAGAEVRGTAESRVPGADGNREFFVWATRRTHRTQ